MEEDSQENLRESLNQIAAAYRVNPDLLAWRRVSEGYPEEAKRLPAHAAAAKFTTLATREFSGQRFALFLRQPKINVVIPRLT